MSRDIKGTSLTEMNDGLERAVGRCKSQLLGQIRDAENAAVAKAMKNADKQIRSAQELNKKRLEQTSKTLMDRIERVQKSLGARIDANAEATSKEIKNLDWKHTRALQMLADKMDGEFRQQQQEIRRVRDDVQRIFQERERDTNYKLVAAGAALALLDAIRERTPVGKFAPQDILDRVAMKEGRLRNLRSNPNACTISDVNDLVDESLVMENEAVRRRNEWEPVYRDVLSSAMGVIDLLERAEKISVPSLYDETQQEELKANYWTHGEYDKILEEIRRVKADIENAPADIAVLKELDGKVEKLKLKANAILKDAAELGMLSEQRVIISNDILNVMIDQGWELKGDPDFMGGDEESDWREGTFAVLSKPATGEELSILVLPENEAGGEKRNQIIFHRNDDMLESGLAFQTRMEQIKREIEKSGYRLGELTEPNQGGGKIEQLRSADSMKKKGAAKQLRKSIS